MNPESAVPSPTEEPKASPEHAVRVLRCFDCGRTYGDEYGFPDLVVPHDAWKRISPTGDEGGLLCPSCICKRAHDAGIKATARFTSGPFVQPDAVPASESDTEECERLAQMMDRAAKMHDGMGDSPYPEHENRAKDYRAIASRLRSTTKEK